MEDVLLIRLDQTSLGISDGTLDASHAYKIML